MGSTVSSPERHPEQHINEEPRNDFFDVSFGMAASVSFFVVITIAAVVISVMIR